MPGDHASNHLSGAAAKSRVLGAHSGWVMYRDQYGKIQVGNKKTLDPNNFSNWIKGIGEPMNPPEHLEKITSLVKNGSIGGRDVRHIPYGKNFTVTVVTSGNEIYRAPRSKTKNLALPEPQNDEAPKRTFGTTPQSPRYSDPPPERQARLQIIEREDVMPSIEPCQAIPLPPPTVAQGTASNHRYTILGVESPKGADLRKEKITEPQKLYLLQDQQLGTHCVKDGMTMLQDQQSGKAEHHYRDEGDKNIPIKPQSDSLWINSRGKVNDDDIKFVDVVLWEYKKSHSIVIIFQPVLPELVRSLRSFRQTQHNEVGIYNYDGPVRCGQADFKKLTKGKAWMVEVEHVLRQKYPEAMEKKTMRAASREASVLALRGKTPSEGDHQLIRELRDNQESLKTMIEEFGKTLEEIKRSLRMDRDSAVAV